MDIDIRVLVNNDNNAHRKSGTWLRRETETVFIAAQKTNYVKAKIDLTQKNSKLRLCKKKKKIDEAI